MYTTGIAELYVHGGMVNCGMWWGFITVSSPREIDPTNFRVETVREAIVPNMIDELIAQGDVCWQ